MKTFVDERIEKLGDSAKIYRLVKDKDIVPRVPPTFLSFHHLGPAVQIEEDGTIFVKESAFVDTDGDAGEDEVHDLVISPPSEDDEDGEESESTRYQKTIGRFPKSLRDHMPEL